MSIFPASRSASNSSQMNPIEALGWRLIQDSKISPQVQLHHLDPSCTSFLLLKGCRSTSCRLSVHSLCGKSLSISCFLTFARCQVAELVMELQRASQQPPLGTRRVGKGGKRAGLPSPESNSPSIPCRLCGSSPASLVPCRQFQTSLSKLGTLAGHCWPKMPTFSQSFPECVPRLVCEWRAEMRRRVNSAAQCSISVFLHFRHWSLMHLAIFIVLCKTHVQWLQARCLRWI